VLTRLTASGQLARAARLDHPPIKMVQFTREAHTHGIETHQRDGVTLQVCGVPKTVADCFKHRNKVGFDVALEALKDALSPDRKAGRVSFADLWRCAKVCRVANVMRPCMEAVACAEAVRLQCEHDDSTSPKQPARISTLCWFASHWSGCSIACPPRPMLTVSF
jgi:hypothetical protein